ncbi:HPr family phosphocarrier protein [Larsenimonas salina]|uniref:HPr family phosphocarrier protein n=1 Tax=Larsenimonas salina TaxID=1295565 RepID=UPI002073781A|nr:HPr family phosphocarrier protein [Larsenimonas salina]MCM5703105.1 HPr family phosphocarrier protein [Larsenimonas salina]
MIRRELTLTNKRGLHARAATKLVQCCATFESTVIVYRDDHSARANNIMALLMLAAPCGTPLVVEVEGSDEAQTLAAIEAMFDARFDEET